MPKETRGYLMLAAAALLWGLAGTVAKNLFNQAMSPLVLAMIRLTGTSLLLLLFLGLRSPSLLRLQKGDIKRLILFGLIGMACVQYFYLYTISQFNVATAVFIEYLAPAFIAIYAVWWKKEKLGRQTLLALLLALGGSSLIVAGKAITGLHLHAAGLLSGLASALAFSFYMIYGKGLLGRYNPWAVLGYGMLFGAVPFWFLAPPWVVYNYHFGWQTWLSIGYIVVFATLIPFGLTLTGLRHLKPSHASITMMLEPVMAGIFAFLLLAEVPGGWQFAGCSLILAGVIVLNIGQKPADAGAISTPAG
jgi:drug/metabolite transporter (DMT)-like permease